MDKTIIDSILSLTSTKPISEADALYTLGIIRGMCLLAKKSNDEKNAVKDPEPVVEPASNVVKTPTFEEFCKAANEKHEEELRSDSQAIYSRFADKANLRVEVMNRWPNKNYCGTVWRLLLSYDISTAKEFVEYFDDPMKFKYLECPQLAPKDSKFKYSEFSSVDLSKLHQLYLTLNEQPITKNSKTFLDSYRPAEDVLKEYLNIEEKIRETRFINSLRRNYISTIHQLKYYIEHYGKENLKKLKGLSNLPDSIDDMVLEN